MLPEKTVTEFITLFRGRGDAYGSDNGECIKAPLDRDRFIGHLEGTELIGVYPIVPGAAGGQVVWGCSDFDNGEESIHDAVKLRDTFDAAGVTAWIERSRSKGFHVWVFAERIVSAQAMRNMFLAAHQVAQVHPKEVNPKQGALKPGQFGNYVRLPYGNVLDLEQRSQRVLQNDGSEVAIVWENFCVRAMECRTPVETIERIAALYVVPVVARVVIDSGEDITETEAMLLLGPLGKVIWRDGPLPGRDRSGTLVKLGYECVKNGLTPTQTQAVLVGADRRWGKYMERADGLLEIDKIVTRVHS